MCICSSLSGLQNLAQGTAGSGKRLVRVAFIRKSKFLRKAVDDLRPPGPGISYLILPLPLNFHYQSQMSLACYGNSCIFLDNGKRKILIELNSAMYHAMYVHVFCNSEFLLVCVYVYLGEMWESGGLVLGLIVHI